jgi:glutathione peroxidase
MSNSIYQFTVKNASGKETPLSEFSGKVILVVNTASECGLTPQFGKLEELYQELNSEDFTILGFPSNDFAGQEPNDAEGAEQFCQLNYGVTFPIMEKVHVKGDDQHEVFRFLSHKEENGKVSSTPKWNFHKYLVDKEGHVVDYYLPTTSPTSGRVKRKIRKLLAE